MDTTTRTSDDIFEQRPRELPSMLNVLTILTFIGCGLSYIGTLWNFYGSSRENIDKQVQEMEKARDQAGEGIMANMMDNSIQMLEKSYEHRYLLLASGLIFTTLCLIGALRMRKLRKSGFGIYTVGELAPVVLSFVLFGSSFLSGITTAVSAFFALLFVILYATQRKHLVY